MNESLVYMSVSGEVYLATQQTANILGITLKELWDLKRTDELDFVWVSARWRVSLSNINNYLNRHGQREIVLNRAHAKLLVESRGMSWYKTRTAHTSLTESKVTRTTAR